MLDYNRLAAGFDNVRSGHLAVASLASSLLSSHGMNHSRVLDLGCGTGNETVLLKGLSDVKLVAGVDRSFEMISRSKRKGISSLVCAEALQLPFNVASFDLILASFLIHHFARADLLTLLAETFRILSPGGFLIIVSGDHAQLRKKLYAAFFPKAVEMECKRTPGKASVLSLMRRAGFQSVTAHPFLYEFRSLNREFLRRIEGKYASQLELLADEEFSDGLNKLRRAIRSNNLVTTAEYRNAYIGRKPNGC